MPTPEHIARMEKALRETHHNSDKLQNKLHAYRIAAFEGKKQELDIIRAEIHAQVDLLIDGIDNLAAYQKEEDARQ